MPTRNYYEYISLFLKSNPNLSHRHIGVLLTADSLYKDIPSDISVFKELYAHMDPNIALSKTDKTTFQKIVHSKGSLSLKKSMLNSYINIKFNDIAHKKSYKENMIKFKEYSKAVSSILDDILNLAAFPDEIIAVLKERTEVRECYDFYEMVALYKNNEDHQIRFEIMRKLGLILLIARINRSMFVKELDKRMKGVWFALYNRLRSKNIKPKFFYFWLNEHNKVIYTSGDDKKIMLNYRESMEERRRLALKTYPIQKIRCKSFLTHKDNEIIFMTIRNKLKKAGNISYTSIVEKIVRKNIEFPALIHDIIGLKIIVNNERGIEHVIDELEIILGGSSTRKKEKNSYHKFGRHELSRYSSKDYFVWKAIYNITLPNLVIEEIKKMIKLAKDNAEVNRFFRKRLDYYLSNPQDSPIEVQLQDINSYLQSITKGSSTEHALLKKKQVRSNSFYKLFPKEIYENKIFELKIKILNT
jgi:hypothetical protein